MKKLLLATIILSGLARAQTSELTAGEQYETLDSERIRLRYPVVAEKEARAFLAQAETYVKLFEERANFKYQRRIVTFLTNRRFQNAYVTGQIVGTDLHIVLPLKLIYSDLYFAGLDGSAMDIFIHEVAHHMQLERGRYLFSKIVGPTLPFDFLAVPSWIWEGYATWMESQVRYFKGRLKPSYNDSILGSTLEQRKKITSFDFYAGNRDWRYSGGANYLVGSEFMQFLGNKYGEKAIHKFIDETVHFTFSSDFNTAFKKSFPQLLSEFNKELAKNSPRARPSHQKALISSQEARIQALARFSNSNLAYVAINESNEPQLYLLDAKAKVLAKNSWSRVFSTLFSRDLDIPFDVRALNDNQSIGFFSFAASRDSVAIDGVLAKANALDGSSEILMSVPEAVAGDLSADGKRGWVVTQNANEMKLQSTVGNFDGLKLISQFPRDVVQVASLKVSPDEKSVALSAYKNNSWNIYIVSLSDGSWKTVTESPAQELSPQWSENGKTVYFLSDVNAHFNVVESSAESPSREQVCFVTQVPWLSTQFVPAANGSIIHNNRESRFFSIDESRNYRSCQKLSQLVADSSDEKLAENEKPIDASKIPSFSESGWKTFIPVTRLVFPYIGSNGAGVGGFLYGESPYKKTLWNLSGNYVSNQTDKNEGDLQIVNYSLHPFTVGLVANSSPGYLRSSRLGLRDPRYNTVSLLAGIPFYNHMLFAETSARESNGRQTQGGYSFTHLFSAGTASLRGAGPRRALSLSNHAGFYPKALNNSDPLTLQRYSQTLALPVPYFTKHSFVLSSTQLMIYRKSGLKTGLIGGPGYYPDLGAQRINLGLDETQSSASIHVKGLGDFFYFGNKAIYGSASYKIPLFETDFGAMHVLDRLWFNPRFTSLRFGPFINGARFYGSQAQNTNWHAAAGVEAQVSFSLIDFLPLMIQVHSAKRLSDDYEWDHSFLVGAGFGG